ncbi:hypothetical protein LTR84_008170 [Exophiala bonariae]|uniref:NADP-dependent oxidoreductase domain-containing protein n=1 Tax=Exophiala bonariae TaxID=1690606 RepID=A0AAV9MXQ8_9EURO|nr:hypothetical protein LTR84_008170 [Exophiala bonariae]
MASPTPVKILLGTHTIGDNALLPGICHFDNENDVKTLLDAFYERGYRDIDTAANYLGSEARLGIAGAPSRFTIHSKIKFAQPGDHEAAKVEISIKESLDALQVSTIETMYLHIPDRQTPFEETLKVLNQGVQRGKFSRYGISNHTAAEVQDIIDICERNGYAKPAVFQGHYNAIVRGGEKELFPLLRKHNIPFYAYSPAAGGIFSGGISNPNSKRWSDDNIVGKLYNSLYGDATVVESVHLVKDATKKYDISGHAAAIRWTAFHSALDGKFGDGLIFAVSKLDQLHETIDALEAGPLPVDLAQVISAVYATVEGKEPPYHL